MQSKQVRENQLFLGGMLLVLLTAVTLRLIALPHIPPGLTHDEADHGLTAVSILQGTRAVYFTIGHGREPLYDYLTAVLMAGIGPHFLAGRLTAVFASLLTIVGMAAWVRRAFDWQTAVFTAAGLAVGFWPLMAARQSLRSITLPALFVFALYFFWRGLRKARWQVAGGKWQVAGGRWQVESEQITNDTRLPITDHRSPITDYRSPITDYLLAGLFLGLTFYTYIPARVLWLVFPLTLAYVALTQRPLFAKMWRGVLLMLALAGAMALPLLLYLRANPEAEVRIKELSGPLTAVTQGDLAPLWQNIRAGVGILFWRGDDFWRYNIPGRPLLGPIMALLCGGGLLLAGWWVIRPLRPLRPRQPDAHLRGTASFLVLVWLLIGLTPVLVTGASHSTTQAMGLQPVLYLFPALALRQAAKKWEADEREWTRILGRLFVFLLFAGTAVSTSRAYFNTWANAPEVRVHYEAAMTAVMHYLNEQEVAGVAVSTITPGAFHTPALAKMILTNESISPRWFDGRTSLIIPHAPNAFIILSGFAALPPPLQGALDTAVPLATLPQPITDLDQPLTIYEVDGTSWLTEHPPTTLFNPPIPFGEAVTLLGVELAATAVSPGDSLALITYWQVGAPVADLRLFSHLTGTGGVPLAQADLLAAPSAAWVSGDLLLQLHEITLPADLPPGQYLLTIGWYNCLDSACEQTRRLLTPEQQDHFTLQEITITE